MPALILSLLFFAASDPTQSGAGVRLYGGHVYEGLRSFPAKGCVEKATTTPEINACFGEILKVANAELDRVYDVLSGWLRATEDTVTLSQLGKQQSTWKKLIEDQCETETQMYKGGSIVGAVRMACQICQTRLRTRALEQFIDAAVQEEYAVRMTERAAWRKPQPPLCNE